MLDFQSQVLVGGWLHGPWWLQELYTRRVNGSQSDALPSELKRGGETHRRRENQHQKQIVVLLLVAVSLSLFCEPHLRMLQECKCVRVHLACRMCSHRQLPGIQTDRTTCTRGQQSTSAKVALQGHVAHAFMLVLPCSVVTLTFSSCSS